MKDIRKDLDTAALEEGALQAEKVLKQAEALAQKKQRLTVKNKSSKPSKKTRQQDQGGDKETTQNAAKVDEENSERENQMTTRMSVIVTFQMFPRILHRRAENARDPAWRFPEHRPKVLQKGRRSSKNSSWYLHQKLGAMHCQGLQESQWRRPRVL